MRNTVINKITAFAKKNKNIFVIAGDAGFGVLDEFRKNFPDRFLNLGIAEQNTIGFSAGLAIAGLKVFVYNIIPFVLFRCYEQVRNDICYQRLPVTLIGIGSGVTYAPQGITHYSVEDVAIARTLPNLTILSPADPQEAVRCAEYALRSKGPVYIRVAKSGELAIHQGMIKNIENPIVIKEGKAVAVLFYGSIGIEVMKAVEELKDPPLIISVPKIQPLNFNFLLRKLKRIHTLITIEEHFIKGGIGDIIGEWILSNKLPFRLKKLGIKNEFIHAIKNNLGMRRHYGISSECIKKVIEESFRYA